MSIAILVAAVAIIGGVIIVASGRGGELARNRADLPSQDDLLTAADVADYRPPPALLGYQPAATEQALRIAARDIAERDEEIAWLRRRLAELQPERAPGSSQDELTPGSLPEPGSPPEPEPSPGSAAHAGGTAAGER